MSELLTSQVGKVYKASGADNSSAYEFKMYVYLESQDAGKLESYVKVVTTLRRADGWNGVSAWNNYGNVPSWTTMNGENKQLDYISFDTRYLKTATMKTSYYTVKHNSTTGQASATFAAGFQDANTNSAYKGTVEIRDVGMKSIDVAKPPTTPNSVVCNGYQNEWWIDVANPVFKVEWSGANAGTYTIAQYSVDATKDNGANWYNVALYNTSGTSGSLDSVSLSALNLKGGETIRIRVGLKTNDGNWWGHTYWGGNFTAFSRPTAPTSFNVPSSQEIDTGFSVSWSGATAGSNGIAGYDLQVQGYNGSSWTDWVNVLVCGNVSSHYCGTPKSLNVNGVSYSNYGENVRFQYRVRTSDGRISTSDWKYGTVSIKINAPNAPRK